MNLDKTYLPPIKNTHTHFCCPRCNTLADIKAADRIISNDDAHCTYCCDRSNSTSESDCLANHYYDILDANIVLREKAQEMMKNPSTIMDNLWYHVTDTPPEEMVFDGSFSMHVGQPETVKALQEIQYQEEKVYLYTFRLKENTIIHKDFVDDYNNWYTYDTKIANNEVSGFAYINRWEAPGSMSLLVRNDTVELIKVENPDIIPKRKKYSDYRFTY